MVAKSLKWALASLLVLPAGAMALGLGDIRLLSALNAPLDAEIELLGATPEDLAGLKAQVASRDTFARYGLDWPASLSSVSLSQTRTADGRQVIRLRSRDAITEPFMTVLVEVNWGRGHVVREYTMLLDPPVYQPGQSQGATAPVAAPAVGTGTREGAIARTPPAAPSPKPASETAASSAAPESPSAAAVPSPSTAEGATRIVRRGETLSGIASDLARGESGRTRPWMLALYQANPAAFERNMNVLHSGAVLRIPDSSAVASIAPSEATSEIRRQYAAWRGSATPGQPSTSEPGRLRLVPPAQSGAAPGTAASSAETSALQGRVHELESQLQDSKRLLEMRNTELAQLQARLASKQSGAAAPAAPAAVAPAAAPPQPATETAPPPPAEARRPREVSKSERWRDR